MSFRYNLRTNSSVHHAPTPLTRWAKEDAIRSVRSWIGLLSVFAASLLVACTAATEPTITFCDTPQESEPCTGNQTEFPVGQKLFVRLASDAPFTEQQIIGKILKLTETDTIPLGSRVVSPASDQRVIVQDLPFHEFGAQAKGTFLIEFVDENNQVIAKKELTIRDS